MNINTHAEIKITPSNWAFYCSDAHCLAKAIYIKQTKEFIVGEEAHIPYEVHLNVILTFIFGKIQ